MTGKEALETLGNVTVAVTTIRSGIIHFKTLKEQYEAEFEVLEKELFIRKELKDFDVYQRQLEKLEKENQELKEKVKILKELNDIDKKFADLATKAIQENTKLKNVIEIFKGFSLGLTMYGGSETSYGLEASNRIILTREQFDLLKEVLRHVKDN